MPNAEGPRGPRRPQRPGGRPGSPSRGRGGPARGPRDDDARPDKRPEARPGDRAPRDDPQQDRASGKKRFGEKRAEADNRTERGSRSAGRAATGRDETRRQDERFAKPSRRTPHGADEGRPARDDRTERAGVKPRFARDDDRDGAARRAPPRTSRPAYGQAPEKGRPVRLPRGRGAGPAAVRAAADDGSPREGDRIAKLLARAGIASRRDIERMIAEGRIAINGEAVTTPATLLTSLQGVTVDGKPVKEPGAAQLFLFYKPTGYLTAARDPRGRPTIYDRLPPDLPRVMPVGRLDMTTEGLLLLTTDGELKRQLELPATGVERTYRARAFGEVSQAQLEELIDGVEIDGMRYGRIDANLERRTGHNQWIEMTITEGKNREVRRVLEHLGLTVNRLIRTRYGPFTLDDAQPGEIVEVKPSDLAAFRRTLKKK